MKSKYKKVIFSAHIDFSKRLKSEGYRLDPNGEYNVRDLTSERNYKNEFFYTRDVEKIIVLTILEDLESRLTDFLDYKVKIQIEKVNYGSIEIIFSVIFGGTYATYLGISKYKNFIESCQLIKAHAQKILKRNLQNNFGQDVFVVNVDTENISTKSISETTVICNKRDGFFYFLFFGFLILAAILGILVYHSFMLTYFAN